MKHKINRAMAALVVGACLVPSAMAQAAEADDNTLMYSFPVNTEDSAGFIPGNEHEKLAPDAFLYPVTAFFWMIRSTIGFCSTRVRALKKAYRFLQKWMFSCCFTAARMMF